MVRRITRLALVLFAVLAATGPSALVLADTGGATGTDSGVAAAAGPLDATDDLLDETTDANVTEENTTDENLTDENLTDENLTEEEPVENETADDEPSDAAETVANETLANTTDSGVPTGDTTVETTTTATEDVTTDPENTTTDTDGTDTADVIETIDDATSGGTDANPEYASLDAMASSPPRLDAGNVGDAPLEDGKVDDAEIDDEGSDPGKSDDSAPATAQERRTENETTASVAGGTAGDGDAGTGDSKSPAGGADSDGSPDRDSPADPPSGTEAVAGIGALAAVAVFPHLADSLTLAGDARALSAASSTVAKSQSVSSLHGELDRLWRTATAFRYSRYDDSDPLAHETRATLHETVERSPGAYLSEVCERADVAVSTARHHLDVLEDEGLVTTAKVRGKRRYFPGHGDDVELAAALEDEEAAAVLRALARLGDSHGGRLADELDRDPSTVSHHLSRLEDAGLVERQREGRAVVNRLAPGVERVLGGEEIEGEGEADAEAPAVAD